MFSLFEESLTKKLMNYFDTFGNGQKQKRIFEALEFQLFFPLSLRHKLSVFPRYLSRADKIILSFSHTQTR